METFATLLRAARALLGESQKAVGEWVGLAPQEVSRWESAGYKLLSPAGLKLQKAFEKRGVQFVDSNNGFGPGVRWSRPGRDDPYNAIQFRAARAMSGLSMREVEQRWGVSRSFLTRFERGNVAALDLEKHRALTAGFLQMKIVLTPEEETFGAGVRWAVPAKFI